ncbi:MAG: LysR family transcriptional regulator [Devosia sp.]|nr:LysR family transcriptional regulator [Devosia sp.]
MNFDDVRVFARIAELKGISATARALGLPKSSVSRALARMEAAAGSALVERSTRHVRLTDAGVLFHAHAVRILGDIADAETALEGLAGAPRGRLRVNATHAFGLGVIAPMLPDFLARYSQVQVALDADDRRIDLTAKDTDLAIRIGPMVDSALIARRLPSVDLWLCASPAYLAAHGTPRTVAELAAHSLVDRQDRTNWRFADAGTIDVEPRVIIPDASAQKVVVEGGAGIGYLPDYLVRPAVASGHLVRVLPDVIAATIEVHALYPSHRSLSAKVRVFIDALAEHMRATTRLAEGH